MIPTEIVPTVRDSIDWNVPQSSPSEATHETNHHFSLGFGGAQVHASQKKAEGTGHQGCGHHTVYQEVLLSRSTLLMVPSGYVKIAIENGHL